MASSSKVKVKHIGPGFYDYLDGLQQEFVLQSNVISTGSRPSRFNVFLAALKGECELMSEEIESLRKERDEYKAQAVDAQLKAVCERCASAPQLVDSSAKTAHVPPSNLNSCSNAKGYGWSISFNDKVTKQLDLEMVHSFQEGWAPKIAFSQDGKYLAAGYKNGKVYIRDVLSGTLICVLRNLHADDNIVSVCFSREGKYLATGVHDSLIYVWNVKKTRVRSIFRGQKGRVGSLAFSPNGRLLASASWGESNTRLWNLRCGTARSLDGDNHNSASYRPTVVFNPDGSYIAVANGTRVRIWCVRTGQLVRRVEGQTEYMLDIAYMPDGKGLVTGGINSELKYWDISPLGPTRLRGRLSTSNKMRGQISVSGVEEQTRAEREFLGHTDRIKSLCISHDGRWLASGSDDQSVRIWNTRNGAMQCNLVNDSPVNGGVMSVEFSPTGSYLASGIRAGEVTIWRYSLPTV